MFILLTSEESTAAEKEQLIHFYENGLDVLHVRKPGMEEEELKLWLAQFKEEHLNKIMLHQNHRLTEVFPVKGIHWKENFRRKMDELPEYLLRFKKKGFVISTSFHDLKELEMEAALFDYVFLSPVFTSISKKGYWGQAFDVRNLPERIIALGGIEKESILKAKNLGYAGVAVLGAVWLAENKVQSFNEMYDEYRNRFG